jgi:hypothetical protein
MGDVRHGRSGDMAQELSDSCIYTIVSAKTLAKASARGGAATFTEKKAWVTGYDLWQKAVAQNLGMPILFADAADCSRLLCWGLLTRVQFDDRTSTNYTVDRVRKLSGRHSPQELLLRSTGKRIAPGFIRPYAICVTPSFLEGRA